MEFPKLASQQKQPLKPTQLSTITKNSYNIKIIPETPLEELQQQQTKETIEFLSLSLSSKQIL